MNHSPTSQSILPHTAARYVADVLQSQCYNLSVVSSCKVYLESESALRVIYVYVYYSSIMAVMRVMAVMCVMAVM